MLPDTATDALVETMMQSLETMAFVMADPISERPVDPPQHPVAASMSFAGPSRRGRVEIIAGRDFALMLAANVLGTDPSDADAHDKADDCLKELVNVVGGALMPHIASSADEQYKLSLPALRSVDLECDWPNLAACPDTHLFNADGHVIAARLVEVE
jgi:chemotaxis protein CheY-P-specific phosphatase CheC